MHSKHFPSRNWFLASLPLAALLLGCGGDDIPRTHAEIYDDISNLPVLYRTTSGEEVYAPPNSGQDADLNPISGVIVDEDSGELAWQVYECHNPDCPGRSGSEPYLFICPRPEYSANPNGTISTGPEVPPNEAVLPDKFDPGLYCPECAKGRNFQTETNEQRQAYIDHIHPHIPPRSVEQRAELEAELEIRDQHVRERMSQNAGGGE